MAGFTFGPVGAIHRGNVRFEAKRHGVNLTENKGLVDSEFYATGPLEGLRAFHDFLAGYIARNDALDRADDAREATFQAQWRWWNPRTWSTIAKVAWLYLVTLFGLPLGLLAVTWICTVAF